LEATHLWHASRIDEEDPLELFYLGHAVLIGENRICLSREVKMLPHLPADEEEFSLEQSHQPVMSDSPMLLSLDVRQAQAIR
jgi:hypothetical protein